MTLLFNKDRKALVSITIASYLDNPKDAVNVTVDFASEPGGLSHVATETINGVSKQLTIAISEQQLQAFVRANSRPEAVMLIAPGQRYIARRC